MAAQRKSSSEVPATNDMIMKMLRFLGIWRRRPTTRLVLVGIDGSLRGKSRSLTEGEYTIGRDLSCDINLPDPKVSMLHARLTVARDFVCIEDLESSTGTYVNDDARANPIFFETLHDRDTIALGPNTSFGIDISAAQATQSKSRAVTVFYSYSHKDEGLRNELETHLSSLRRAGLIQEWHDRMIVGGQKWGDEISSHLGTRT